jgi:hypothetical protein
MFLAIRGNSTPGFDENFDVGKIFGLDEAPQIFTEISGKKLSINAIPAVEEDDVIPVGFECQTSAVFTLEATGMDGFSGDVEFYLEDLQEGIIVNLKENPVYAFTGGGTGTQERFRLHLGNPEAVGEPVFNPVRIYTVNGEIHILNLPKGNTSVYVYDLLGRQVASWQINEENSFRMKVETITGYYVVKVQTGNQLITEKVFIK